MRLPFPEKIPLKYAIGFALLLSGAQQLQGTSSPFILCSFLFIVIATLAFNAAGGLSRPSGGYVFFYAVLAVILGLFCKAILGEPADSNLTQPLVTIQAQLGGITGMFGAVLLSRRLTVKRPLLAGAVTDANMHSAAMGCLLVGIVVDGILWFVSYQSGSVLSTIAQLNRLLPLALILGTIYQIRKSGGTSSINLIVLLSSGILFAEGCVNFSKQALFTPLLCWLIAAASQRYRVSRYQVVGLVLVTTFMVYYLVPYSQYGRNFLSRESQTQDKGGAVYKNVDLAIGFLSTLGTVREEYEKEVKNQDSGDTILNYFNTSQGFFDRLQMISMDDGIINVTEQNGPLGFFPVIMDFENFIPHVIWPGKPTVKFGNVYAHELGILSPDDDTTGISFSPMGEAFHLGRWIGIFIVAPILWVMLFTLFDSLCGDARKYPWGLLATVLLAHEAPEGGLGGAISMMGYGAASIVIAAITAAYVMSIIGSIFTGAKDRGLLRTNTIRSIPRRIASVPSSGSPVE